MKLRRKAKQKYKMVIFIEEEKEENNLIFKAF